MGKTLGEKGNLVMFQILEDPNPPVATTAALSRVRTRARHIRRRRNALAASPAALAIGASGLFVSRLDDRPEQVATIPTSIPFTDVSTLPPFDDRGEELSLLPAPDGYYL